MLFIKSQNGLRFRFLESHWLKKNGIVSLVKKFYLNSEEERVLV